MTFSTGFTAVSSTDFGQDLYLRSRIYVASYGADTINNLWDFYGDSMSYQWTLSDPVTASTTTSIESPTTSVVRLMEYGEYAIVRYSIPQEAYAKSSGMCLSVYVHSGSTDVDNGYDVATLKFYNETQGHSIHSNWFQNEWTISDKNAIAITGSTDVGSGWTRISVGFEFDTVNNLPSDSYYCTIEGGGVPAGVTELYWSSPMIEANVTSARAYFEKTGQVSNPSPNTLLAGSNDILSIGDITQSSEREFGVTQGQVTQVVMVTPPTETIQSLDPDSWLAIQVGYPSYDLWETVAQGSLGSFSLDTNLRTILEVNHSSMKLIEKKIDQDIRLQSEIWFSDVKDVDMGSNSDSYDDGSMSNIENVKLNYTNMSGLVRDTKYTIVFDDTDKFRIYNKEGLPLVSVTEEFESSGTTYSLTATTTSNPNWAKFSPRNVPEQTQDVFKLDLRGFYNLDGGTYTLNSFVAGDTFGWSTAKERTADELTPIGIVKNLIEDIAGIQVYDVLNDSYYDSPLFDTDNWTHFITAATSQIQGYWKEGTRIIQMVQDALILEHGSLFPTDDGRIQLHVPVGAVSSGTTTTLNGNPLRGDMNVLVSRVEFDQSEYGNIITMNYLDNVNGSGRTKTVNGFAENRPEAEITVECGWEVPESLVDGFLGKALTKFNDNRYKYTTETMLDPIDTRVTDSVYIDEPFIRVSTQAQVTSKSLDVEQNKITFVAWNDPLSLNEVARIGKTRINQTDETVW